MERLTIALVLPLIAMATPAAAQTAGAFMANPAFRDTPPATCVTTFDMQHCAAHELRVADAAMSRSYYAARARLTPARQRWLLADQRRWLGWRDRYCPKRGDRYAGGTLAPVAVARCWVEQTKARTVYLRGLRR